MPIRARVGRHAKAGGRHCQNWADDQNTVVALLNQIPVALGGAGGTLRPRIVAGIASDDLYQSILQFEERYFPGQRSGFIDPDGLIYQRMLSVTTAAPVPGPATNATEQHSTQPSEIDHLLQELEKLRENQNYAAVRTFLLRLKNSGYTKVIQNDAIMAYLFGTCRLEKSGTGGDVVANHRGTPLFYANWVTTGAQDSRAGTIVMFNHAFLVMTDNTRLLVQGPVGTPFTVILPNGRTHVMQNGSDRPAMRTQSERDALRQALKKLDRR